MPRLARNVFPDTPKYRSQEKPFVDTPPFIIPYSITLTKITLQGVNFKTKRIVFYTILY